MSGQVDFIVAPEADAPEICRDHLAIQRRGGATWKRLDHTKLYALYGLLDGRFQNYEQFCRECRSGPLSLDSEHLICALLREFEPGELHEGAFLHRLPERFIHLLAQLQPKDQSAIAAHWNASAEMRKWPRERVEQSLRDLCRLAQQALVGGHVLYMRVSNQY